MPEVVNDEYSTRDLYLATYLTVRAINLKNLVKGSDNRFTFYFQYDKVTQKEIDDFYSKKAQVEPLDFATSMKAIKSKMYNLSN